MTRPLLSIFAFGLVLCGYAQDSLFYANGMVVIGEVEELGVEMVRYRTVSGERSVVVVAEKRFLKKVKLAGGQEFVLNPSADPIIATPAFLASDHALSLDFIAPATNHLTIGYEQSMGTRVALTARLGYIGLYRTKEYSYYYSEGPKLRGGMLKLGIKFILPPSPRRLPTARDQHPLAGWYLRPELLLSAWQDERSYHGYPIYGPIRTDYASAALNMVVGRQVILGSQFTFDLYGGIGYGLQWRNGDLGPGSGSNSYRAEYSYSHIFVGSRTPLAISGGMTFGFLF
ncbi:MAG: hypothetical protein IPL52_08300 [Flavobacteriales bacterium]|nr:hypothetical protein [Flavobacteriales bacterium]